MFKEKRFGMFIHWGIYSLLGFHEQVQWIKELDAKEYQKNINLFNPTEYNPKEWVKLAKDAGMDYICFTTKHHDGFCMWDTKYTDFNIMNTPYGKDVLKELSEACEEAGISLSLYYSVPDWHHINYPNFGRSHELSEPKEGDEPNEALYIEYVKNQIRELLTNYGKILSFFWDIPPETKDASVNALIRELQPGIYINDRGYDDGDFSTPEREVPEGESFTRLTEACDSVSSQAWGYRKNNDYYSNLYMTSNIDQIMARGGNYLLNVGPDELGRIPEGDKDAILGVGKWYNNVKEALYAQSLGFPIKSSEQFFATRNKNTLYLHFIKSPMSSGFYVRNITKLPKSVTVLNDGSQLDFEFTFLPRLRAVKSVFHANKLNHNTLSNETVVLKLEFDNLDESIVELKDSVKQNI